MPIIGAKGSPSSGGFGQFAQASTVTNYIEDVFSTYLYTGTGSALTITNNIDLSTKGGLIWTKARSAANRHALVDTVQGGGFELASNLTNAANAVSPASTFGTTGYTMNDSATSFNQASTTYASWTFRKQPKFFDVQTFTDSPHGNQTINHNLGATPAVVILKSTSGADSWYVYHTSLGTSSYLTLNGTGNTSSFANWITVSSTQVTIAASFLSSGSSYVMYLFASNAGGFGLTGTDNVISCGSWTGTGSAQDINLGYEPQFLIIKNASSGTTNWVMLDNMRGLPVGTGDAYLKPNLSDAEVATSDFVDPTATGFRTILSTMNTSGNTFIYIAIRRGPMKVPTDATTVFSPVAYTGNATDTTRSAGFPVDMLAILRRSNPYGDGDGNPRFMDRLRGGNSTSLISSSISAEETSTNNTLYLDNSVGFKTTANNAGAPTGYYFNVSTNPYIAECFRRAPSFFDLVCYTGTGSATTFNHNLQAVPELMIVKRRAGGTGSWRVYNSTIGVAKYLTLNATDASSTDTGGAFWNGTTPTSTVFSLGTQLGVNGSGSTYVAYLFATCAGVSKVGSYTGNGSTQTINCGFIGGARFVLIKRTDSTGDWYVYDTARGMTTLTDPYLLLNSTAAESATLGSVTTVSTGFAVNASILAAINTNGASYIFLAVA